MNFYYIAIVFGDDRMEFHTVWAATKGEAVGTVMRFYQDSTVLGILFIEKE